MNRCIIILSLFLLCLKIVLATSKDFEIKMIVDVLQSFIQPSHVVAQLCWTSLTKKKLTSTLASLDVPKSIKFKFPLEPKDILVNEKYIFLVDIRCSKVTEVLKQADVSKKFTKPYRWLIIGQENDKAPSVLGDLQILPDSEVYVTQNNGSDGFIINLIYKIKQHRDWIIENYGVWTPKGGLNRSKYLMEVSTAMRRKNLHRETIVTSMVVNDNSTLGDLDILRYPQVDSVTKSAYHQLSALYDFTNATRRMITRDAWGYHINGSWIGILGDSAQGKAELPGSVIFITKERMNVVDYLTHPTPSTVKFIFREPPLSYQNNLYLLPFSVTVWCSLGVFVVILIMLLYINAYWEVRKIKTLEENCKTPFLVPKVGDVTVFVMGAISQQGNTVELKGSLGRFVTLILLLVCLFLYTAYSASIVVLLQASSSQIRTLTDLLHSKLELGVEDTSYNRYLFANEKEPVRKMIYEKKIAPPGAKPKFYGLVEGVRELQKRPFAFNCNLGAAYKVIERYFFEHEKCGLQEISYIQDSVPWQACRKGSPYTEIFKIGLLRNAETGLNDRTNHLMFSKKPVCSARGGSFVSVALVDCYPSLLLLLYGMILSVTLLLAELLYHRRTTTG